MPRSGILVECRSGSVGQPRLNFVGDRASKVGWRMLDKILMFRISVHYKEEKCVLLEDIYIYIYEFKYRLMLFKESWVYIPLSYGTYLLNSLFIEHFIY